MRLDIYSSGDITAATNVSHTTENPIQGRIEKIVLDAGTIANGSLYFIGGSSLSSESETFLTLTAVSGTGVKAYYPRGTAVYNDNTVVSGVGPNVILNDHVIIAGSALGTGVFKADIYYTTI